VDRELKEITSEAKRKATEIRGQADAEATKLYGEAYNRNADFYFFQKSLESYRNIIGENTSLILSPKSELLQYLESTQEH
jgi:membrane protease subunit HflC